MRCPYYEVSVSLETPGLLLDVVDGNITYQLRAIESANGGIELVDPSVAYLLCLCQ